jgi:hypothetical protein
VLTQDGNLLLTGITDSSGHWRYPFSGRQTQSHFFRLARLKDPKQFDQIDR